MSDQQFRTFGGASLDGDITDVATTITVDSVSDLPAAGDFMIRIGSELIKVTGLAGNDLTVVRAQEGTTNVGHTSGDNVYHIITAGAWNQMEQTDLMVRAAFASRPAAGVAGRIFMPTDDCNIYFDTGAAWVGKGPIFNCTPALDATFTGTLNAAAELTIADANGMLTMIAAAATANKFYGKYLAYPGSSFTAIAGCQIYGDPDEQPGVSLALYNATGYAGVAIELTVVSSGLAIRLSTWAGMNNGGTRTGVTTVFDGGSALATGQPVFLRWRDDGTDAHAGYSFDLVNWLEFASYTTADYDQIAVGTIPRVAACTFHTSFPHWSLTWPA